MLHKCFEIEISGEFPKCERSRVFTVVSRSFHGITLENFFHHPPNWIAPCASSFTKVAPRLMVHPKTWPGAAVLYFDSKQSPLFDSFWITV